MSVNHRTFDIIDHDDDSVIASTWREFVDDNDDARDLVDAVRALRSGEQHVAPGFVGSVYTIRRTDSGGVPFALSTAGPFVVCCEVHGGVTGHRTSLLKSNNELRTFATRDEAQSVATTLRNERNNDPYRKATFHYWVEPQRGRS